MLIAAFVAVFGLTESRAQNEKGDITLAPQIGLNLSTYAVTEGSYDLRTSFTGGAIMEYYFSDRWSLRSGLIYDPTGAEDSFNNVDKLNFLSLPINANWHFGKNRNWYLNFGPSIAFLLNAEADLNNGDTIDIKDAISSTDIGLSVGIGYKFNVNDNVQLFIDYQGYNGLINLDKNDTLPVNIRNARSAFNLGGIFSL